jgi:hypothetical protein
VSVSLTRSSFESEIGGKVHFHFHFKPKRWTAALIAAAWQEVVLV